jgi:hypothetical protein
MIADTRPDLKLSGVDVVARWSTHFPVSIFDGKRIPRPSASVDVVMLIDVLHHAEDPLALLADAARVARISVLIKDHCQDGVFARQTLRLMDWVGNAHHGVSLPYNYLARQAWNAAFQQLGLRVVNWRDQLGLYVPPVSWCFERRLHFIACVAPPNSTNSERA